MLPQLAESPPSPRIHSPRAHASEAPRGSQIWDGAEEVQQEGWEGEGVPAALWRVDIQ